MPARDKVLLVVSEWVLKAENDLKNAAQALRLGDDCPTDTVCFHAQQCIEKYLKALCVLRGTDFPKTHDVKTLMALLPVAARPSIAVEDQERITDYATGPRYPGWPEISLTEARRAVALARRVRKEIRKRLPKATWAKRK
jgi:HEPN domain-containing protein